MAHESDDGKMDRQTRSPLRLVDLPVEILTRIMDVACRDSLKALSKTAKRLRLIALPKFHACLILKDAWDWNRSSPSLARDASLYLSQQQLDLLRSQQGQHIPWSDAIRESLLNDSGEVPEAAAYVTELSVSTASFDPQRAEALILPTAVMYVEHLLANLPNLKVLHMPVQLEQR